MDVKVRMAKFHQGGSPAKTLSRTLLIAILVASPGCVFAQKPVSGSDGSIRNTDPLLSAAAEKQVANAFAQMPLMFEKNIGETASDVRFSARTGPYMLFLSPREAVLTGHFDPHKKAKAKSQQIPSAIRFRLAGANRNPQLIGLEELRAKTNHFVGNDPTKWQRNVPNYARVRYEQVYPGVDLEYYGNQGSLEYDFVVAPEADANVIRLEVLGEPLAPAPLSLASNGDLLVHTDGVVVRLKKPIVYQQADSPSLEQSRQEVAGSFILEAGNRVGFKLGSYDHSQRLIIDPAIVYSTYLGGSNSSIANSVAMYADPVSGHVYAYVAGGTCDTDFPTKNALQGLPAGGGCGAYIGEPTGDAFVAKIDPSASGAASLLWSTYLGSSDNAEYVSAIAVDSAGNVYLTGNTNSLNFPVVNAFQSARRSPPLPTYYPATFADAFLSKISAEGSILIYSTYFGGSKGENAHAIALDAAGRAYIAGETSSSDLPTFNAYQPILRGTNEGFVAIFDTTYSGQSSLLYATYLGGSNASHGQYGDAILALGVDLEGNASLGGYTQSLDFPTTANGFQKTFPTVTTNFRAMSFYAKLNPFAAPSSQLVYSTFLGWAAGNGGLNGVTGAAVDSAGNAYLVGNGIQGQIPITPGAYNFPVDPGVQIGFVAKINPAQSGSASLIYFASLAVPSGSADNDASAIAVDPIGNAYVLGHAGPGIPLVNAVQNPSAGIFESRDAASSWAVLTEGFTDFQFHALAIDASVSPRKLYAGSWQGTIYATTDGGLNWNGVHLPDASSFNQCSSSTSECIFALVVDPQSPSHIYAGTTSGIYRSMDSGVTWQLDNRVPSATYDLKFDQSILYAGTTDGLYAFSTATETWNPTAMQTSVRRIAIDSATSPHTVYVALSLTNGGSIYRSTNVGTSWLPLAGPENVGVYSITIDTTTTPSTIYVTPNCLGCGVGGEGAIFRTSDSGVTWSQIDRDNLAFSGDPEANILVDTTRTPRAIYFPAEEGLARSIDGGNSWESPLFVYQGLRTLAIDSQAASATVPAPVYSTPNLPPTNAFVAELNSDGTALLLSTYFGGIGSERTRGNGIALDSSQNIYIAGSTNSVNLPVISAFQPTPPPMLSSSAFFAKIGSHSLPSFSSGPIATQLGVPIGTLTVSLPNITGSTTSSAPALSVTSLSSADTANFSLSTNLGAYDISSTATFSASTSNPITLCFQAQTVNDLSTFNGLRLIHIVNGSPVDSTSSRDFSTRTVCGSVTSLSPFILINGTPALSWSNPQIITYGATLSSTQLNATANVPGTFTYSPASGTVLGPGQQTLSVTFTPSNPALYSSVTKTTKINVLYSKASCSGDLGHTVLQPINTDGSSVFKLGSTVPTKFRVCDANGVSVGLPGTVASYTLIGAGTTSGLAVDEDVYSTSSDSAFRWDSVGKQWIFNQGTGKNNPTLSQTNTVYRFSITLKDGSSIQFQYGLK